MSIQEGIKIKDNNIPDPSLLRKNTAEVEYLSSSGELNPYKLSFIDSSSSDIILSINIAEIGTVKDIVVNPFVNNVTIVTNSGSFRLHKNAPRVRLIFTENGWKDIYSTTITFPNTVKKVLSSKRNIAKNAHFGECLHFSGDGKTLFVGSPNEDNALGPIGSVSVFVLDNFSSKWIEQAKIQTIQNITLMSAQGFSLASSYDGNVLAIGGPMANQHKGKVWIWKRSYNADTDKRTKRVVWRLVQELERHEREEMSFGWSVAMNDDGKELIVGCPRKEKIGEVYCFRLEKIKDEAKAYEEKKEEYVLSQTLKVTAKDIIYIVDFPKIKNFGESIVLRNNTLVVNSCGILWMFSREGSEWKLSHHLSGNSKLSYGSSFDVSHEADIIATCILDVSSNIYIVVYTQFNGMWRQSKINTGLKCKNLPTIKLSSDGRLIAVSDPSHDNRGIVHIYGFHSNKWELVKVCEPPQEVKPDESNKILFGLGLAINNDSTMLAIGASCSVPNCVVVLN